MARAKGEVCEQRIVMEAVVDAYGPSERAMGWYYYLDGKMKFPFKARCRLARPISVLRTKEGVEVAEQRTSRRNSTRFPRRRGGAACAHERRPKIRCRR
jgi:hypothetical protein